MARRLVEIVQDTQSRRAQTLGIGGTERHDGKRKKQVRSQNSAAVRARAYLHSGCTERSTCKQGYRAPMFAILQDVLQQRQIDRAALLGERVHQREVAQLVNETWNTARAIMYEGNCLNLKQSWIAARD